MFRKICTSKGNRSLYDRWKFRKKIISV